MPAIRRTIRSFTPVTSANTEREEESHVSRERREAARRSLSIPLRRFTVPMIVDESHEPSRRRHAPDVFARLNFGHVPTRAMRRTVAS